MKNLGPEKFRVKIWVPKNFGLQKNFDPEKVWVQKIFVMENFVSRKNLGAERIWFPKKGRCKVDFESDSYASSSLSLASTILSIQWEDVGQLIINVSV